MENSKLACNYTTDSEFGPAVRCEDFDFTLAFEQSIFFIGVSSLLLLILPLRISYLYNKPLKLHRSAIFYASKVVN